MHVESLPEGRLELNDRQLLALPPPDRERVDDWGTGTVLRLNENTRSAGGGVFA